MAAHGQNTMMSCNKSRASATPPLPRRLPIANTCGNGTGAFRCYRTVLGFQACHLDVEFYDTFYRPEALGETQRKDFEGHSLNSRP